MQRSRQHQLGARQKQAKQNLLRQRSALDVARAQAETHSRGVGGDRRKRHQRGTKPYWSARATSQSLSAGMAVSKLAARLRERLLGHGAQQLGLALQMAKEHIELTLNAQAAGGIEYVRR